MDTTTRSALRATGLDRAMQRCDGHSSIGIGILDGPVAAHPALPNPGRRAQTTGPATVHATMVAGVLAATRGHGAPGICPRCRLIVYPIFRDDGPAETDPAVLADQIVACVDAGARLLNVSAAYGATTGARESRLDAALDYAYRREAIVVVAAGNAGRIAGSPLVSHRSVIPVASCDAIGRPMPSSNLGISIGGRGVLAPGYGITSIVPGGGLGRLNGTSAATTLVTGALALAWAAAPATPAVVLRRAVVGAAGKRRGIVPPLLDAWALFVTVARLSEKRYA